MTPPNLFSMLQATAERDPDQTALIVDKVAHTYGAYARDAGGTAGLLQSIGVRKGDRVAVCLPKSYAQFVAVQGILATGAAYVPVDSLTSVIRFSRILSDVQPRALITTGAWCNRLFPELALQADSQDIFVLSLAQFPDSPQRVTPFSDHQDHLNSYRHIDADLSDYAYILFTSGSTGRAKGVVHTHGSALTFVTWAAQALELDRLDRVSQIASLSFDLSVFDVFAPTLVGATLVPMPESDQIHVSRRVSALMSTEVTVCYCVPSFLLSRSPALAGEQLAHSSLRHIVFAGEPISKGALRQFAAPLQPDVRIHNWYGPTETNVITSYIIDRSDLDSDALIPIGFSCPYAQLELSARQDGRTFDLTAKGKSLMHGYWGDAPKLSAPQPLYHTGDIVAVTSSGPLLFIGREDRECKINGVRVNLGEIESLIDEMSDALECGCWTELGSDGEVILCAAISTHCWEVNKTDSFEKALNDQLPQFMVPQRIFYVDKLPRNSRGKIDLARLATVSACRREPTKLS